MTVYAAVKAIMGEDDMAELSSADNAVPRKPSSITSAEGRQAYDKVQGLSCVLSTCQLSASLSVAQEVCESTAVAHRGEEVRRQVPSYKICP